MSEKLMGVVIGERKKMKKKVKEREVKSYENLTLRCLKRKNGLGRREN